MAEYLLKVSFAIGIALLFYKLLLQQESFFGTNRVYFICCILMAFALPYIQLPRLASHQGVISIIFQADQVRENKPLLGDQQEPGPPLKIEKATESAAQPSVSDHKTENKIAPDHATNHSQFSWGFWLLMLYVFGLFIFSLNLLFQIGSIYYKIWKSIDKIQDNGYVIINTPEKQAPCSFFRYIFIHPDEYDFETYEQIIAHEKIHVQQGHSWDLFFSEIAVIVLWFNPLIWLYKKEVEKNIEFQTDALLIEKAGINKSTYQLNLLQIAAPDKPLTITTSYNQSLLKQRIMMMNAKKSTLNRYWKYAFTAPLFLGAILLLNEPAVSQHAPLTASEPAPAALLQPPASPVPLPEPLPKPLIGDTLELSQGFYYSYQTENNYCIDFKGKQNNDRWNINECFDKSLFKKQSAEVFTMTRETGTLKLMGALDQESSQGKYEFTKNPVFEKYLSDKLGVEITHKDYLFHLHLHDVNKKYVDDIKKNFNDLSADQFLAMAIHGIDQAYLTTLAQAGFNNLDADQVIAARIHGVNSSTIKELQALGFGNMAFDKVIMLNIHEVDADFLESLKKAGFKDITIDETVTAKIHGLTPEAIKEIKSLGFGDLSLQKMIELKIHDVDTDYINELRSAGFSDLSLNQIVQAKIHDVDPSTLQEMEALGFKELSFERLLEAKIHGVNAAYLRDLDSAGFSGLTIEKVIEAKIHGVDSDFIKKAKSKGYKLNTLDEYIRVKIHGLASNSGSN